MKIWFIKKLINSISSKEERHEILTMAVADLYPSMDNSQLLTKSQKGYMFEGRVLDEQEVNELRAQAELIQNMRLWNMLDAHVQQKGGEQIFYKSQTIEDLVAGKLIILTWDILKSKLNSLRKSK